MIMHLVEEQRILNLFFQNQVEWHSTCIKTMQVHTLQNACMEKILTGNMEVLPFHLTLLVLTCQIITFSDFYNTSWMRNITSILNSLKKTCFLVSKFLEFHVWCIYNLPVWWDYVIKNEGDCNLHWIYNRSLIPLTCWKSNF